MHRFCIASALFLFVASISTAQTQMSDGMSQATTSVIDGAVHPELIPDVTAYRMWLMVVSRSPNSTNDQSKLQHLQLAGAGLQDADESTLVAILADFNVQYNALIQSYNAAATAAGSGGQPDVAALTLQRDTLVQSTHDRIKVALAADAWARVDALVQNEKRHMKIGVGGGQQ